MQHNVWIQRPQIARLHWSTTYIICFILLEFKGKHLDHNLIFTNFWFNISIRRKLHIFVPMSAIDLFYALFPLKAAEKSEHFQIITHIINLFTVDQNFRTQKSDSKIVACSNITTYFANRLVYANRHTHTHTLIQRHLALLLRLLSK